MERGRRQHNRRDPKPRRDRQNGTKKKSVRPRTINRKKGVPLKYIVVQRQTKTRSDVLEAATIDDYWNMDGDKSLSEPWIGVTRSALLNTNPPEGYMWIQSRLTKKHVTTRRGNTWPE